MQAQIDLAGRLSRAVQQDRKSRGLDAALALGGAVLDGWFGGDLDRWRNGQGVKTVRALIREQTLEVSASTLYRFVAITALCRRMGRTGFDHLGTSHLRQVLPLTLDEQVEVVMAAEEGRWTVQQVTSEVRRRQTRRRRPMRPSGSFLAAVPHLRRWERHTGRLQELELLEQLPADRLGRLREMVHAATRDLEVLGRAIDDAVEARRRDD